MKFSIIVVSLNPGNKLKDTLKSVRMQTYQDYEVIIKDGGSKDDSLSTITEELKDQRITLYQEPDKSIYEGMNQAVVHATGDYVYFLNCGDAFHDEKVLERVAECLSKQDAKSRMILYGNIFGVKNQVWISPSPVINGFTCYRNVPCHQACFYDTGLCKEKAFETKFRIRGDYEHFLWCYYRGKAGMVYLDAPIADYEGGGYSETKENLKRSKKEHKEITEKYMSGKDLFRYRSIMLLTLAPVRTRLSESPVFSGMYNKLRSGLYRK